MANKGKNWKNEYEEIKNELLIDKVSNAIKKDPKNWKNNMEEIGFTWIDDSQEEIEEEKNANPMNVNQEYLVAYFEEKIEYSNKLIEIFIKETGSKNPNYSLFRKYFKVGNTRLLHLLISGLSKLPTNQVLLSGISYFHENRNILTRIVNIYTKACNEEKNTKRFQEHCIDFINDVDPDGYDALAELKSIFQNNREKYQVLEEITKIMQHQDEIIEF